jgi:hypothetical protein
MRSQDPGGKTVFRRFIYRCGGVGLAGEQSGRFLSLGQHDVELGIGLKLGFR